MKIQTYSSTCGVLSVDGVFFYKGFCNFVFCKMSKTFLFLSENSQNCKNKLLILVAANFLAEFSRCQT